MGRKYVIAILYSCFIADFDRLANSYAEIFHHLLVQRFRICWLMKNPLVRDDQGSNPGNGEGLNISC